MSGLVLVDHHLLSGADVPTTTVEYQVWEGNRLLYVGIADDFASRWSAHVRSSWWLGEVSFDRIEVTGWPSREVARWSEASVINQQSPIYNTARELAAYARAEAAAVWPAPTERFVYMPREVAA
jgi:hypothetical protein